MAKNSKYNFSAKVWLYPSESANWHFVSLPKVQGVDIKEKFGAHRRGFGSIPVQVIIGETSWQTSIFPDKTSGSYLLPIKAKVRNAEDIDVGDIVQVTLVI